MTFVLCRSLFSKAPFYKELNRLIVIDDNGNKDVTKSLKLEVIIPAYRMHTQTFLNVLDGITEEDALKRIDGRTNHIIWMAGNYVNVRYAIAHVLGEVTEDPYQDLFFMGKALDESFSYPSLKITFHYNIDSMPVII
jgi:hypothetical protein